MATQNISATIEKNLLARLDLLAAESERNRSWVIGKAIESYLEDVEDLKLAKQRLNEPRLTSSQLKKQLRTRK